MDVRQLRYFAAIVASGSISRAAAELNVAQPALSLHVRNMEADLGVDLLHRTPQGVQPTEAGTILYRHARTILQQFEEAQREVKGSADEPSGEVRLGLPSGISRMVGVPIVLAARERLPKVTVHIAEAMSGYVLDWLRLGRVDLALLYGVAEDRNLHSTGLLTETLVLFGPAEGGEARPSGETVGYRELAGLPLILPGTGNGLRDGVDEAAALHGIRLDPILEIDAFVAIRDVVERGIGYSILPAHLVAREVEEGRLAIWQLEPALKRTVHLVRPTDRPPTLAAKATEALCRDVLRDLVSSGEWPMARLRTAT